MASYLTRFKHKRFRKNHFYRRISRDRFFIEYRTCGKMRLQILELRDRLTKIFPEIYHKNDKFVSHITLIPPITGQIDRYELLNIIKDSCYNKKLVEFKISGYGYFDNDEKVIFAKINPGEEILEIRDYILKKVKKKVSIKDDYEKNEGFNPHITLGWVRDKRTADKIIHYLDSNHPIDLMQIMDRITIMNGERILWEYDIFNKKVLSRYEALRRDERLANIRRIIEMKGNDWRTSQPIKLFENPNKLTFWEKIKLFFMRK